MSWACKGYMFTSEIKTFDYNVKQNVLNDEKRKKLNFDTRLYHVLLFRFDVKVAFLHFLTFQRTESSNLVIFFMLEWHKQPEHFC